MGGAFGNMVHSVIRYVSARFGRQAFVKCLHSKTAHMSGVIQSIDTITLLELFNKTGWQIYLLPSHLIPIIN